MNPTTFNAHKPNTGEKATMDNNKFNRQPRMQNYPYTTQWKDGKPVYQSQSTKDKNTPDPLQINSINMIDDRPWCIVFQSPHSSEYCAIAQSFFTGYSAQKKKRGSRKKP